MAITLWFAGLVGLLVAAGLASTRRATSGTVASRRALGVAACAYAGLVAATPWLWGGAMAREGRAARLRDGAAVVVELAGIRVPHAPVVTIGHAAAASVRVPGDGPDELARIELDARGGATVRGGDGIAVAPVPSGASVAEVARAQRCGERAGYRLPAGASVVVVDCARGQAFAVRRDAQLVITPLAGRAFSSERRTLRSGDALRLGGAERIPGLVTWELASPHGAAAMLAIPLDPTDCAAWSPEPGAARARDGRCEVTTGAFELVAWPTLPEAGAVLERGVVAAVLIGAPALLVLVALAVAPRRGRGPRAVARALRLAVLGAALAALVGWRLVWAYRIDRLDPLQPLGDGTRVAANELATLAIGAALAGAAIAIQGDAIRSLGRRAGGAVLAWAAWLGLGALVLGLAPPATTVTVGVAGLSLVAALAPLAGAAVRARPVPAWLSAELVLVAVAGAALVARAAHARGALVKLGLAYATVLAGHAALRALLGGQTALVRRVRLVVALGAATSCVALLDTGVSLAVVGSGLVAAMLVAGHDALYDASQASRLGLLEREHARLLLAHGLAACGLAIGVAAGALAVSDHKLLEGGARVVLHAPLVATGLFVLAALVAHSLRRGWVPWLAAALAALALWGVRDAALERATEGSGVAARRMSAIVEPGYALLRDDRSFVANASAWREAALAPTGDVARWDGQGYFAARIRDPGVVRSLDNDYLPVLVAREAGVGGLMQSVLLLLAIVVGGAALASARTRHASREHRARWLVAAVAGSLAVYQPLAALGVLPLTGISWPGLGIDSPGDLWLFVVGALWCYFGGDDEPAADEARVRRTPRLQRARRVVLAALVLAGVAAGVIVARAGACALVRASDDDARVAAAMRYAGTLACAAPDGAGAVADVIPAELRGEPTDDGTRRFHRELGALWTAQRVLLVEALAPGTVTPVASTTTPIADPAERGAPARILDLFGLPAPEPDVPPLACPSGVGAWRLARRGESCVATLEVGWPEVTLALTRGADGVRARCSVAIPDDAVASLRVVARPPRERIRVVSAPLGIAGDDVGEVLHGTRVVRLRPEGPARELATLDGGVHAAGTLAIADTTLAVRASPRGVVLRGPAELFVADGTAWRRTVHAGEVVLDRLALVVAGPPERRVVVLFRPARAWPGAEPGVDTLLADTAGDRVRRIYPHGARVPELGWVNPYDVERSLGLDGWIHAALPARDAAPACGTLAPPPIPRERVCTTSPLDGVTECRVALQPQLALALRGLAEQLLATPARFTRRDTPPVRVGFVALRGDTGEILAQGTVAPGRPPLAFPPHDARAEAELVRLRDEPGEADAERVDWNLPIAVGSTFKPVLARAAEQAFPDAIESLTLTAAGHAAGCKRRRGGAVDPVAGHCPPTSVAGSPTTADLHDFLARSPNWYQAALGLVGLGLPHAELAVKGQAVTFAGVVATDLATWPADSALEIRDAHGPILGRRSVSLDGLRRTPLWQRVEALLGRPLCTLGDRRSCERAAARADVCAARALPIAAPGPDLRNLVALGPDRVDPFADNRPGQTSLPVTEYFQLLRGSGVHPIGSLAQITDAFGRVVYDPAPVPRLAASWFPAPAVGVVPAWSCREGARTNTVLGAGGGLCGVVLPGGTGHAALRELLADPTIVLYGAKTGTTDSLADIARSPRACRAWNARHPASAQLACGKTPPDDSLFVIAFGVVTPRGTIPITLGIQLQRAGKGAASHATPAFVHAIAAYLRG